MNRAETAQLVSIAPPLVPNGGLRLKVFTRADAFGAILEIASAPASRNEGKASLRFYEFICVAQLWRDVGGGKTALIAAALLDVIDRIAALESGAAEQLPPPFGAFLLAAELVRAKGRRDGEETKLVERVRRTLQVNEPLARQIVTVLTDPHW